MIESVEGKSTPHSWRVVAIVLLALWWGGLTFYAAVVVPLGTQQFGSLEQGLLTQQVTQWLNGLGGVAAIALLIEALVTRRQPLWALALAVGLLQGLLWFWHGRLSSLIDPVARTLPATGSFYFEHQVYLWLTAVQWGCGLVALWYLAGTRR